MTWNDAIDALLEMRPGCDPKAAEGVDAALSVCVDRRGDIVNLPPDSVRLRSTGVVRLRFDLPTGRSVLVDCVRRGAYVNRNVATEKLMPLERRGW